MKRDELVWFRVTCMVVAAKLVGSRSVTPRDVRQLAAELHQTAWDEYADKKNGDYKLFSVRKALNRCLLHAQTTWQREESKPTSVVALVGSDVIDLCLDVTSDTEGRMSLEERGTAVLRFLRERVSGVRAVSFLLREWPHVIIVEDLERVPNLSRSACDALERLRAALALRPPLSESRWGKECADIVYGPFDDPGKWERACDALRKNYDRAFDDLTAGFGPRSGRDMP